MHPHPRGYVCMRAAVPPAFDGNLEMGEWGRAAWTEDFLDIEGAVVPRLRTRAKMLWDEDCFYIAAEMEEPDLWATYTEHDSVIFQENDFEAFFDPDGDCHGYFEYEVNALGTDWDLRLDKPYRDQGNADNSWEVEGLRKAVVLRGGVNAPETRAEGWTVVLGFPWSAFGLDAPLPGAQWRVNFSRVEWDLEVVEGKYRKIEGRPEHNWVWSPQWAIDMHRPELWGYVQFGDAAAEFVPDPDWDDLCFAFAAYRAHREGSPIVAESQTRDGFVWFRSGRVRVREDSLTKRD
ncbi:MAG: carbohydrate-binding family 9-like protein [Fimbriimonadaceae bacterium]